MKFVVLGGTGMMGRIAVRDLFESDPSNEIVIASTDSGKAREAASKYKSARVSSASVDVRDHSSLSRLLKDSDVAVNCVQYQFNPDVMEGALKAGTHYVDLGGLYYTTLKQLKFHPRFKKEKLTAILGMGSTPGITNVLAAYGAEKFDKIDSIDIKFGAADFSRIEGRPFPVPYSISTLIEEFTLPPIVYRNGKITKQKPLSGFQQTEFPPPIGKKTAFYTLHSELATFPSSFRRWGVKNVTFRVSFDRDFVEKILFMADTGMASDKPIDYKGTKIVPRELLAKVISKQRRPEIKKLDDYECLLLEITGKKGGKRRKIQTGAMARSIPEWNASAGDVDTGTPPSIVAQMLARGMIGESGVFPPEYHVPIKPFFKELEKRKMKIFIR
jgi:saccharopine dehydrogenase-like NADP-dependent oxidoreductase